MGNSPPPDPDVLVNMAKGCGVLFLAAALVIVAAGLLWRLALVVF